MTSNNTIIQERTERTKWFLNDRYGIFIHWGLYAILARGEWVRSVERISVEDNSAFITPMHLTGSIRMR
ncbi:hypothetical protein GC093_32170 [Paenibacillus sp. LMG 31456]|uniref:Glycoside hydrolase family 29 N-terminal domain-containing protein n=1 Tax=Paenibacillus foliorum TaxID=2654974 RepID=A0A972K680_9BACL|nr:alpha-L-fucosidase [Paenibacillus foliorum]NOU97852.1 hypothetical protein [Paenibacillus foliorum]